MRLLNTTLATMGTAIAILWSTPASASHDTLAYRAALEYRDAARGFEREVIRARCFDRTQQRLASRLTDAAVSLRVALRQPQSASALWIEIQTLQAAIAESILGDRRCPAGGNLALAWKRLTDASAIFGRRLELLLSDFGYRRPAYYPVYRPIYGNPYGCPIYVHHFRGRSRPNTETINPAPKTRPYWDPARTRYGQGLTEEDLKKTDRTFGRPVAVPTRPLNIQTFGASIPRASSVRTPSMRTSPSVERTMRPSSAARSRASRSAQSAAQSPRQKVMQFPKRSIGATIQR